MVRVTRFHRLIILGLIVLILLFALWRYLSLPVVKSDVVGGFGNNQGSYEIVTSDQVSIPASREQYIAMGDNSQMNVNYLVVYEEKKLYQANPKLLKIMRFERPLSEQSLKLEGDYFHQLVDEQLERVNEDHSVFVRLYELYQGNQLWSLKPESYIVPPLTTVQEAKEWILDQDADALQLLDRATVHPLVLSNWEQEGYDPTSDYTDTSPEGAMFEDFLLIKLTH